MQLSERFALTHLANLVVLSIGCVLVVSACGDTQSDASGPDVATVSSSTSNPEVASSSEFCSEMLGTPSDLPEVEGDLDGDGVIETVLAEDSMGPTVLHVCSPNLNVTPFEVGNANQAVLLAAVDVEGDGVAELLVGKSTDSFLFSGTALHLIGEELVDQRIDLAVSRPDAERSTGMSFSCFDTDSDGDSELLLERYEFDAPTLDSATVVTWTRTAISRSSPMATQPGSYDLATEQFQVLDLMNGTCGDQLVVEAASLSDLPPADLAGADPSQSGTDAERDGVIAAVASLPFDLRVDPLLTITTSEGDWILSKLSTEVIETSSDDGCGFGDLEGTYPIEVICAIEYGELLLIGDDGQIERAYPMPAAPPSWIHETPTTIYAGHIGDGGLPDSTLVRIDRETLEAVIVVLPTGLEPTTAEQWLPNWHLASAEQFASAPPLVGFAPEMVGTAADSWIGQVVIDIPRIDQFIDATTS